MGIGVEDEDKTKETKWNATDVSTTCVTDKLAGVVVRDAKHEFCTNVL